MLVRRVRWLSALSHVFCCSRFFDSSACSENSSLRLTPHTIMAAMPAWYHLLDKRAFRYDYLTPADALLRGVEQGRIPTYIITLRSLTIKNDSAFGT